MRTYLAASAAFVAFTAFAGAPANAADHPKMPVKAAARPAPAPASWTQFYVGGGIGLNAETGKTNLAAGGAAAAVFSIDGLEGANLGLSATAGFDVQVSPLFVVGAFADYDWSHQDTTLSISTFGSTFGATTARLDGGWTIGGRAGILLTPDILLYGLGGFSRMRLTNWGITASFPAGSFLTPFSLQEPTLTLNGHTVGAGIEYRLSNNVSLRGEYRFVSLGHATTVDTANSLVWTTDASVHIGRVVAAYRFGGPGMSAPASLARMPAAWTGFYGAIGFGADAISRHVAVDIAPGLAQLETSGLGGADIAGTFMVGFDYQLLQSWVAGIFGNFDVASNGNARFAIEATAPIGSIISTDVAAIDKSWTAGGRVGYLISPDALLYGLAGYTMTSFHSVSYNLFGAAVGTANLPDFRGVTIGGGFEKLIADNVSVRAEYRNTRLGTQSGYAAPGLDATQAQHTINAVRMLLAYRLATK